MKTMPLKFNLGILLVCIAIFGQAVRICEAPLSRITDSMDHFDFVNSTWSVVLTMTTVGYGDIYPRTFPGRLVMFMVALVGVVIVSIVVLTVQNLFEMSSLESKAYTVVQKINIKKDIREHAAEVITRLSKLHLKLKNN
jgi:Ion channel